MMRNFPQFVSAVQRNCDISDARHAGDYGLCTFLLKMREYYRWESELPFGQMIAKEQIGEWLTARERHWDLIEADEFVPLPLADGEIDPFDAEAVNCALRPLGYVYSAGVGRHGKPVFFLGELLRVETRADYTVLISSCEHARELAAPPAMLQGATIFVRQESLRRYLWEKVEEWQWRRQDDPMGRTLASHGFAADPEGALDRLAADASEAMILHEVGEAIAGDLIGDGWRDSVLANVGPHGEPLARAVRDLLADCLSTLPGIVEGGPGPSIHFYFATFDALRRQMFPQAWEAYEHFLRSGDCDALLRVAKAGADRWLAVARGLVGLSSSDLEAALKALVAAATGDRRCDCRTQ